MQYVKKYFTEGLIQFTILLSLIGVRVDVDTYLSGYFSPLVEIDGGPSSAFIQTPFHRYRDTAAGHQVHPKCPELDRYLTSRRLLSEVRALGSPARFPTRLSAWLVHLVPDRPCVEPDHNDENQYQQNEENGTEPGHDPPPLSNHSEEEAVKEEEEEISLDSLNHLTHSLALENEVLFGNSAAPPSGFDLHPGWQDFLTDFDQDFASLAPHPMSGLDVDLPDPISYDASLQDAMLTSGGDYRPDPSRSRAQTEPRHRASLFRLESTNSSHSDAAPTSATTAMVLPAFSLSGNGSHNASSHSRVGGYLDEAVFEHINLLGLDGLESIDSQLLSRAEGFDSDSGLSLESSSRSPASASTSSNSDSLCEDEGGATGYSSEAESLSNKGGVVSSARCYWQSVWHDHAYSFQPPDERSSQNWAHALKVVKKEEMSDDDEEDDDEEDDDDDEPEELSRDGRRLQALGLPFTAPQIVSMPVEDFLELLEGRGLSLSEVTLLRDVRRRGKNKLAAQNCRKRKLDAIAGLQGEVEALGRQRDALLRHRARLSKALSATAENFEALSTDLLQQLSDEDGRPLCPERYMMYCTANGRVAVRPRARATRTTTTTTAGDKSVKRKKDKKP